MQNGASKPAISAQSLSQGVLVCTLTPFDNSGALLYGNATNQAKRLAGIDGILGTVVYPTVRERLALTCDERLEIVCRTRAGLEADHLLLVCCGELTEEALCEVRTYQVAGADAIISVTAKSLTEMESASFKDYLAAFTNIAEQLPLPVIIALSKRKTRWAMMREKITALAQCSDKIIGFEMGADDDVLHYDQNYYALKSLDRPVACLPSSEGALFHNLNTGGDGALSSLAYIAPHEVSALYRASRDYCFPEAQAIHNRLAPLVALLNGQAAEIRELLYREAAYHRGILGSPHARGLATQLSPELRERLHKTISDIGLKPVI